MANLNAWQKIDRVISGRPFGNGSDGNVTLSSDTNTRATASGSSGSTALTIGSAILSNGDTFIIYQTYGGNWEVNRVTSGGGTTSIVCQVALQYTYGTGSQVIKFALNNDVTLGSFAQTAWNGSTGGVSVICANGTISGTGTLTLSSKGFGGGQGWSGSSQNGWSGAGYGGASTQVQNRGDNAGGGGTVGNSGDASGGGGGNGVAGGNGSGSGSSSGGGGIGGKISGSTDLTTFVLGGGGGGGHGDTANGGAGGTGGGAVIIFARNYAVTGSIISAGSAGASADSIGGGGGAGGTVLIICQNATLGSFLITALGASGGGGSLVGGPGGNGRIAVHHSLAVTGTTNPTFEDISDTSLRAKSGMAQILW